MNTHGYKIIHIGDGTENGSNAIIIVKANPIHHEEYLGVSYTPYECEETEWFFFPDRQDIVNQLLEIAQGEGIWYPNNREFKDGFTRDEDSNRRMLIHRHRSFWSNNYKLDLNSGRAISLIPDIQYKIKTLNNQYYQGDWSHEYFSFRDYVESLAEGDDVENFWGWLFGRRDFNGYKPYELPTNFQNEYHRFLDICSNFDNNEY